MAQEKIGKLLIRADATSQIGTGHVMRCLALAQAWQDAGGEAMFLMAESTPGIRKRLNAERCEVISIAVPPGSAEDAHLSSEFAQRYEAEWVVIDGYRFDSRFQKQIRSAELRLLCVDDEGRSEEYVADLVLNQNLNARANWYGAREEHRLLLGASYCMLRREFTRWRDWQRTIVCNARKVLITLGGSTPVKLGLRIMESLEQLGRSDLSVVFVIGGSTRGAAQLHEFACSMKLKVAFETDVADMGKLMAEADVAISAAGSTCWELCLLGLPSLLIDVAENQTPIAQEMQAQGCALHIGSAESVNSQDTASAAQMLLDSAELRRSISKRARDLVDGRGADRVVQAMLRFSQQGVNVMAQGARA